MNFPAEEWTQTADSLGAVDVTQLVDRLKSRYGSRITGDLIMPARPAQHAAFPAELHPNLRAALQARGITQLYSHQREAWDAVTAGRHTVVVTPTASGKTLCYNLPVLHAAMTARSKALYLISD